MALYDSVIRLQNRVLELRRELEDTREGWAGLAVQVEMALRWSLDEGAEPTVALKALRRYLADMPAPMDALDESA